MVSLKKYRLHFRDLNCSDDEKSCQKRRKEKWIPIVLNLSILWQYKAVGGKNRTGIHRLKACDLNSTDGETQL